MLLVEISTDLNEILKHDWSVNADLHKCKISATGDYCFQSVK